MLQTILIQTLYIAVAFGVVVFGIYWLQETLKMLKEKNTDFKLLILMTSVFTLLCFGFAIFLFYQATILT